MCKPKYGWCHNGTRGIPIKLLDVAGLIPGASEGAGLGNKFLDDLRAADVLIHVLDASGCTNEKGEATKGYDPSRDVDWLTGEIHAWIFNNLWTKWSSITRRHTATKATVAVTLQGQLSGYGAGPAVIAELCTKIGVKEPNDLATWDEARLHEVVAAFLEVRFPTVLLLNKADTGADSDRNIARISRKYDSDLCIVASALAETYLKAKRNAGVIKYPEGASMFFTRDDEGIPGVEDLVVADEKTKRRLDKLNDMVMFRFGGTGVWAAVQKAAELRKPVVAYPVRSLTNYSAEADNPDAVFANAVLLKHGSTIHDLCHAVNFEMAKRLLYAEGARGRLSETDVVEDGLVCKFVLGAATAPSASGGAGGAGGASGSGGAGGKGGDAVAKAKHAKHDAPDEES